MMIRTSRLFPVLTLATVLGIPTCPVGAQDAASQTPKSPSATVLQQWNYIGNKIIVMAEDWPAEKYSFRPVKEVRTFGQVLLHVAGSNYGLLNQLTGKKLGNDDNDPSPTLFKSKDDIVSFLKKSVSEGASTIEQQGDAGVSQHLADWIGYTEHMGEHYGLLVAYYRVNGMVPPDSRKK